MLVGVSQTVNGGFSQALARTLLLSGQQRLRDLLAAAPRLHLPVERVLEICSSGDAERTPEETAAQALLELCLGLVLQLMAEDDRRHCTTVIPSGWQRFLSSLFPFPLFPPTYGVILFCVPLA
jgi:hypothetical protein